ncbi:MAG: TlpA family protein disulfide reductase [Alphaproteobacteria bacterium]|nr:TlpA family protein disulfide reductase [Alphaproteobacteria bacterium]
MPVKRTEIAIALILVRRARASISGAFLIGAVYAIAGLSGNVAAAADAPLPVSALQNFVLKPVPAPLPPVQFQDSRGAQHDLAEHRNKVLLVNFWATWCAPCREEMPSLDRLQQSMGGPDFEVVIISLDRAGYSKAEAFLKEIGVKNLTTYVDPGIRAARQLGALGLPVTLLLNRKGAEIGRLTGAAEWDSLEARALITNHTAGK